MNNRMFEVATHTYGRKLITRDCPMQGCLEWPQHKWTRITFSVPDRAVHDRAMHKEAKLATAAKGQAMIDVAVAWTIERLREML